MARSPPSSQNYAELSTLLSEVVASLDKKEERATALLEILAAVSVVNLAQLRAIISDNAPTWTSLSIESAERQAIETALATDKEASGGKGGLSWRGKFRKAGKSDDKDEDPTTRRQLSSSAGSPDPSATDEDLVLSLAERSELHLSLIAPPDIETRRRSLETLRRLLLTDFKKKTKIVFLYGSDSRIRALKEIKNRSEWTSEDKLQFAPLIRRGAIETMKHLASVAKEKQLTLTPASLTHMQAISAVEEPIPPASYADLRVALAALWKDPAIKAAHNSMDIFSSDWQSTIFSALDRVFDTAYVCEASDYVALPTVSSAVSTFSTDLKSLGPLQAPVRFVDLGHPLDARLGALMRVRVSAFVFWVDLLEFESTPSPYFFARRESATSSSFIPSRPVLLECCDLIQSTLITEQGKSTPVVIVALDNAARFLARLKKNPEGFRACFPDYKEKKEDFESFDAAITCIKKYLAKIADGADVQVFFDFQSSANAVDRFGEIMNATTTSQLRSRRL